MRKGILVLLYLALCTVTVRAESNAKEAEKTFADSILKQRLVPRGFSADSEVHEKWTSDRLIVDEAKWRTLGILIPDSVRLKSSKLEIKGVRRTLVKDGDGNFSLIGGTNVRLLIDLGSADPVAVLPELKSQIFYPSVDASLKDLPKPYRRFVPYTVKSEDPKKSEGTLAKLAPLPCSAGASPEDEKHPQVVRATPPVMPESMRHGGSGTSALVGIAMTVDSTGYIGNFWLTRSAGFDEDESALDSVQQYVMKPATCKGHPITSTIQVDVNFQMM